MTFKVGDRVKVRPEFDELAKIPIFGRSTRPGTVDQVFEDGIVVVAEDDENGVEGGGSAAPYEPHELELLS